MTMEDCHGYRGGGSDAGSGGRRWSRKQRWWLNTTQYLPWWLLTKIVKELFSILFRMEKNLNQSCVHFQQGCGSN
ncbi:hypothetical protein L1887_34596 [Cichorium endivia]|nr:hypothetical protein L1887_34596 [Cichorium endivia]